MISTATRAVCALLSTMGAAGLVMIADPTLAGTAHHPSAHLAAAPRG